MQKIRGFIQKLSPAWRWCLTIWLAAQVILTTWIVMVSLLKIPPDASMGFYYDQTPIQGGLNGVFWGFWQRWDAIHYQRILTDGYNAVELSAFFPTFPILGRVVVFLTGIHPIGALTIVSQVATLLLLVVLYQLLEEDYGTGVARSATLILLLLPTGFFLFAPYPTSLSLLLALLAYRAVRARRLLLAAVIGLTAGLTHGTGMPLALLLGLQVLRDLRRPGVKVYQYAGLLVPLTPLMGTTAFLAWRSARGFPGYSDVLMTLWERGFQWPWISILRLPNYLTDGRALSSGWSDLIVFILSIATLIWGWKHLKRDQWVYSITAVIFLLTAPHHVLPLLGYGRYALMIFPMLVALASWLRDFKFRRLVLVPALLSQFVLLSFYYLWVWVD